VTDRTRAAEFRESTPGTDVEFAYAGVPTFMKAEARDVTALGGGDGDGEEPEPEPDPGPAAAVLGVPYDAAVSNRPGTRYGPRAVRAASAWWTYLSGYKHGLTNMRTGRTVDLSGMDIVDCGDVPVFPLGRERTADSIAAHVATAAETSFPVVIGGDHYCTAPAFRGFAAGAGRDTVGLVQIDAHTDTTPESDSFDGPFHGSTAALIADSEYASYDRISQVGIRGYESPGFYEFADETGLNLYPAPEVDERGAAAVVEDAIAAAADGADAVYVTFDIDAVEPGIAPGTGTPEAGGLSASQALTVMETLGAHDAVGAADLMEVAPTHDPADNTARLGANLLVALLERQFAERE